MSNQQYKTLADKYLYICIFSTKESNSFYLLSHIGILGHSTVYTAIHETFSGHRIGRCEIDIGWFF